VAAHHPEPPPADDTGSRIVPPAARRAALEAAAIHLRCPVCGDQLRLTTTQLICGNGHSFDIARQGYVNLTAGRANPGTADTAAMIAAREEFLGRGYYRPLARSLASLARGCEPSGDGLVVDLAGGTGYYLAAALDALPHRHGLCVDLSTAALQRAARAHPRAAAAGADVWQHLPLASASAALVLSVFGPRNAAEIDRILTAGGVLIVAAPGEAHLQELRGPLGLIGVDQRKPQRLADAFGHYANAGSQELGYQLSLGHAGLMAVTAMGPSAHHIAPSALADRIQALPSPVAVTVDLRISAYRRPG
jgi:23S rRNA (guanine745-N1)-methyltransferase